MKKIKQKMRQAVCIIIALYMLYSVVVCPFLLFNLKKDNNILRNEINALKTDLHKLKKDNNIIARFNFNVFAKKKKMHNSELQGGRSNLDPEVNIRALIDTIAESEGGSWHICYGGIKANYSLPYPCPRRKIGKYISSAYGSFQVLDTTWQALAPKECKKISQNNAQKCQIKVFKKILANRKILNQVNNGNISAIMPVLGKEWASVPDSPYGQKAKFSKTEFIAKFEDKREKYSKFLKKN